MKIVRRTEPTLFPEGRYLVILHVDGIGISLDIRLSRIFTACIQDQRGNWIRRPKSPRDHQGKVRNG